MQSFALGKLADYKEDLECLAQNQKLEQKIFKIPFIVTNHTGKEKICLSLEKVVRAICTKFLIN